MSAYLAHIKTPESAGRRGLCRKLFSCFESFLKNGLYYLWPGGTFKLNRIFGFDTVGHPPTIVPSFLVPF